MSGVAKKQLPHFQEIFLFRFVLQSEILSKVLRSPSYQVFLPAYPITPDRILFISSHEPGFPWPYLRLTRGSGLGIADRCFIFVGGEASWMTVGLAW